MQKCICRAKAKVHNFTPKSRGLASDFIVSYSIEKHMFYDVLHFWIQGKIPCLEAHWEYGGEKLLLQTFAYGMFYFL